MKTLSKLLALGMSFAMWGAQNSYGNGVENPLTATPCSKSFEDEAPYDVALEFVRSKDYGTGSKLVLRVVAIDSGCNAGIARAVLSRDGVPIETWENKKHVIKAIDLYEFKPGTHTFTFEAEDYGGHRVNPRPIIHNFKLVESPEK